MHETACTASSVMMGTPGHSEQIKENCSMNPLGILIFTDYVVTRDFKPFKSILLGMRRDETYSTVVQDENGELWFQVKK